MVLWQNGPQRCRASLIASRESAGHFLGARKRDDQRYKDSKEKMKQQCCFLSKANYERSSLLVLVQVVNCDKCKRGHQTASVTPKASLT